MIDTDKYEGHTEGHWTWMGEEVFVDEGPTIAHITSDNRADANLIADAPLLLKKIKELRKRNEWLEEVVAQAQEHYHIDLSDEGWPRWREEE
tara:strand:- start:1702 stop:1977 length:276 start_codon:yes stop_codon:yes gene_type:complete